MTIERTIVYNLNLTKQKKQLEYSLCNDYFYTHTHTNILIPLINKQSRLYSKRIYTTICDYFRLFLLVELQLYCKRRLLVWRRCTVVTNEWTRTIIIVQMKSRPMSTDPMAYVETFSFAHFVCVCVCVCVCGGDLFVCHFTCCSMTNK